MYTYIHIYIFTDARLSIPIHLYTHVRTSTRTRMHEEMVADERCVCVCAHLGIRTCLDAQASIQAHIVQMGIPHPRARTCTRTHSRRYGIYAHTHTNTCTHTYVGRCMHVVIHVPWARACAAPDARANARTHTHTYLHDIYTHIHMRIHALTHIHTW